MTISMYIGSCLGSEFGVQMMTFTQHPYMLLSSKALPLWIALLSPRDSIAKHESQGPSPPHTLLPLECVSALLDLAGASHTLISSKFAFNKESVFRHQSKPEICVASRTGRSVPGNAC